MTGLSILAAAGPAAAHPLGNFTVNTYSGLRVQPDRVVVDLVVDMAEIPALQARRGIDTDGDGKVSDAESAAYAARACPDEATRMALTVDGRPAAVRSTSSAVEYPPGAAGLTTLRLTCVAVADTGPLDGESRIEFRNANNTDRVGWREVTAVGDRTTLTATDVPSTSASDRLTTYPGDLLTSPLDQRAATLRARPGGPPAPAIAGIAAARTAQPRGVDAATRRFTDLVSRQDLTLGFGIVALALAVLPAPGRRHRRDGDGHPHRGRPPAGRDPVGVDHGRPREPLSVAGPGQRPDAGRHRRQPAVPRRAGPPVARAGRRRGGRSRSRRPRGP
jgi:hypothetical protein